MKLSVIVPLFNEANRVSETLDEITNYLEDKSFSYEIIPVNDGSTDQTGKVINNYADNRTQIRPISYEKNQGKGHAVKRGMKTSDGDLAFFTDADLSTPLKELNRMLEYVEDYDIVIGSRALEESNIPVKQPFYRRFLGNVARWLISFILQVWHRDTQCGFKLFTKDATELFEKQKIRGFGFDFEILFLAKKEDYKVKEMPITWRNDPDSRVGISDWFFIFIELISVRINELRGLY